MGLHGEALREEAVPVSISGLKRSCFTFADGELLRTIFLRRALFDSEAFTPDELGAPLSFFGRLSKIANENYT